MATGDATAETKEPKPDATTAENNETGDAASGQAKEEMEPKASFGELFRFASRTEVFLSTTGALFAMISGCFTPVFALILGAMIDTFVANDGSDTGNAISDSNGGMRVSGLAVVFLIFGGVALFAEFVNRAMLQVSAELQLPKMKKAFLDAVLRQDIAWSDENPVGKVQSILTNLDDVTDAMGEKLSEALGASVQFFAGIAVGFFVSWRLTMVMIATAPLLALGLGALMLTIIDLEKNKHKWAANSMRICQEAMSSVRTVYSLCAQENFLGRYEVETANLKANFSSFHRNLSVSLGAFMVVICVSYSLTLWYGSILVDQGRMTPGEVITVFFAIQMGSMGLAPLGIALSAIGTGRQALNPALAVIDRVPAIDSSAPRDDDGGDGDGKDKDTATSSCQGAIELRDVHFAYPTRPDVPVFQGYSLAIPAGKTVALVGESGGGKSTVISLLERFYDPQQGQVLLDGRDVRTLNVQWLREQIGLVSQEPVLFASSIMENIRHGKRGATDEEVVEAAKMANADGFISSFPDGYDTEVGERGVQLSGGQKQRIAIARAVIKDPTILLLDEATSALDSESERVVQAALDDLMKAKRRTTIVVAHRLSTVRDADSIAVVYNGKIVEQGTHDELMGIQNGNYRRLASRQQAKGEEN